MASPDRQRAEQRGRRSETLAAWYLRAKGYRILDRRVRCPMGEIDLVAQKGGVVVFVEVKARKRMEDALEAVTNRNWLRVSRAAEYWMARRPDLSEAGWRYDLVGVAQGTLPRHVPDAWRPGLA